MSYEEKGLPGTQDTLKIHFEDNKLSLIEDGEKSTTKYQLRDKKTHYELDIIYDSTKNPVLINHAIIKIQDGCLVLCGSNKLAPNNPEDRPANFVCESKENKGKRGFTVITCKRVKE